MPDIFLSYNRQDQPIALRFRDALAAEGFDVWWDVGLRSGDAYDEVTEKALRDALAVVVLWSERSVASRWVRAEATLADRGGTIMPVMIEPCQRPIMFELIQTPDLSLWRGNVADPAWLDFVADVRRKVYGDAGEPTPVQIARGASFSLPSKPSIAVLPFVDLDPMHQSEHLADGIVEEISTALSRFQTLFVIAGASSLGYRDSKKEPEQICRELGVRYLLQGSIRTAGNRIRVTTKLIDGIAGEQVWADKFDDELDHIFDLQDRVAHEVAGMIDSSIDTIELKRASDRPTITPTATALYWRANALFRRWDPPSLNEAIALTDQVLAMEPDNGWAASLAGFCHATLFQNGWAPDPMATRARAMACYELAMRVAGDDVRVLGYAGATLGCIGGDPETVERLIARTIELNPGSASTLFWGGWNDIVAGRFERGLERFETSLRLNPRSIVRPFTIGGMGLCIFFLGRYDESNIILKETVQQVPMYPAALAALAAGQALADRPEAAETAARWRACGASLGALAALRDPAARQRLADGLARAESLSATAN
ncbi:TIR domain-containing protein [Sandarakinorhabdus sp. AAP62]|uniref:TIR domain-containing protein n=1 Tax=Sandarakinorhabdus sp. AAP62 TaxID=1248916 RepID=UPI0002D3EF08|nr:TIR domain-containing protein [Sandarakinorhabdus sp. AAP62]